MKLYNDWKNAIIFLLNNINTPYRINIYHESSLKINFTSVCRFESYDKIWKTLIRRDIIAHTHHQMYSSNRIIFPEK